MFQITPTVRTLLIINVVVLFLQHQFPLLETMGMLHPIGSSYFRPWQFVTYMFMHANIGHLFSNMLVLLFFGAMLEEFWGARRFLIFWLICGIGAGVLYEGVRYYELRQMNQDRMAFLQEPTGGNFANFYRKYLPGAAADLDAAAVQLQRSPNDQRLIDATKNTVNGVYQLSFSSPKSGMLGASGAVFGFLFALAYLFPNRSMILFPLPIPISMWIYVFFFTAYELWKGIHPVPGDNVAHFAHLGGMVIGFIVLKIWQRNGTHYG